MDRLKGKVAVITGGNSGVGEATAKLFAKEGAVVVITARREAALTKVAEEIKAAGGEAFAVSTDISKPEDPERLMELVLKKYGKIDILINNAGMQYRCKAESFPVDKWKQIIDVNLNAVFILSQLAGQTMLEQGHGKIINIASMTSFFGSEMVPAYSASKGGIMQLTKALANEWMQHGINVNAIAPGYMETALTSDMKLKNPAQYEEITRRIPAHRWGKGEDLAGAVIFLSSEASDYISGAIIPVDGGYLGK